MLLSVDPAQMNLTKSGHGAIQPTAQIDCSSGYLFSWLLLGNFDWTFAAVSSASSVDAAKRVGLGLKSSQAKKVQIKARERERGVASRPPQIIIWLALLFDGLADKRRPLFWFTGEILSLAACSSSSKICTESSCIFGALQTIRSGIVFLFFFCLLGSSSQFLARIFLLGEEIISSFLVENLGDTLWIWASNT